MRVLAEIRRAQVRIRIARSKLEALGDMDSIVKLEALNELLDMIAMRLETLLILGYASGELIKSSLAASRALESLRYHAPPDVGYVISELQQFMEMLYATRVNDIGARGVEVTRDDVEAILREAMEAARMRVIDGRKG